MNKQENDLLVEQIRCIILNKPLPELIMQEEEGEVEIQEALVYLSECLSEANRFLRELSVGNLNVSVPSRKNFLSGNLKELHAGLKHLTWQANQVANGDYSQNVSFLGEFSTAFNRMIVQLHEREERLLQQSNILTQTNVLMHLVMDGLKDWLVVVSQEGGEIIYINESAKLGLLANNDDDSLCGCEDLLLSDIKSNQHSEQNVITKGYRCLNGTRFFRIATFPIRWNDMFAYANHIEDVTSEQEEHVQFQNLAYKDELTGLYNRRYCTEKIEYLLSQNQQFIFCMIDVDKLKYANDTFGHSAGDEYLSIVAREITAVTRSTDIICRLGGDEFSVIFPDCPKKLIEDKIENINKSLLAFDVGYPMSISYGTIDVPAKSILSSKEIMIQADSKMYHNKQKKRKELLTT